MGHDYKPLFGCSIDADRVCVVVGERAGRRLTQLLSNPSAYASRGRNEVLHMHALSLKRSLYENRSVCAYTDHQNSWKGWCLGWWSCSFFGVSQ
jgi:hypothetical protein